MSMTPPAEPPRFVLPGSESADPAVTDPAAADPAAADPAVTDPTTVDPATTTPEGQPVVDPAAVDPILSKSSEQTLEEAIAAALAAPDEPVSPEAGIPAPVDGEPGVGAGVPSSPAPGTPTDPTDPASSATESHPTDNLIDLGNGLVLSADDLRELALWSQSLTPQQQALVEQVTLNPGLVAPAAPPYPSAASGSGVPAPVGPPPGAGSFSQYPAVGQPGIPLQPQPQPGNVPSIREQLGEIAEIAPGLATVLETQEQRLAAQQAEIQRYQQFQAEQAQRQIAAEREQIAEGVRAGDAQFIESHPELSEVDIHYIRNTALQSGLMATQMPLHGNDAAKAYQATLETIMWSDPKYRNLLVQQQATEVARRQAEVAERRENASALTGNPGSVPRESQSAPALQTPEGRQMGMREYIAQAIAGGMSS